MVMIGTQRYAGLAKRQKMLTSILRSVTWVSPKRPVTQGPLIWLVLSLVVLVAQLREAVATALSLCGDLRWRGR
jgi:hypothetical protein